MPSLIADRQFQPGLQPGLRHAFDRLSTFFVENLVANLLHQSRYVEIDAAGSFVLDKWNVEKTHHRLSFLEA